MNRKWPTRPGFEPGTFCIEVDIHTPAPRRLPTEGINILNNILKLVSLSLKTAGLMPRSHTD